MLTPKETLANEIYQALGCPEEPTKSALDSLIDPPKSADLGDLTFACFTLAKTLRKAPQAIASDLKAALERQNAGYQKIDAVGGYLNVTRSDKQKSKELYQIVAAGDNYGRSEIGAGKTAVLDFSSPNIAKPFHIGHLGSTAIGHSLQRIHKFCGYKTVSVNHLGDWGTQFGRLIVAYRRWGSKEAIEQGGVDALGEIYRRFYEEADKDPSLNDEAREAFAAMEAGDEESIRLWQWFKDLSLAEFKRTYALLDLDFDSWAGESFYNDKMSAVIDELKEKGLLTESDGAMVVDLSEEKMPPCIILKSDGSTIYATRDITAAIYRHNTYHFDKCIYVTDAGQSLHFRQWFAVIGKMGYDWADKLIHVPYGKLSINGARLASRTGNVILLRDLFADAIERVKQITLERNPSLEDIDAVARAVGVGAVVFHQLSTSKIKDISFDPEEALNFDGNTGPYVQYTYARTQSVLEKANLPLSAPETALSFCAQEQELFSVLTRFSSVVQKALAESEPSVIARYALELCQSYNRFYQNCPVLKAEGDLKSQRLNFCAATGTTLKNCLWLLGISAPRSI